jgi:SAM-dependent methyltransferase
MCGERLALLEGCLQARAGAPLRILDVGCGAGIFTDLLLESLPRANAYCVDASLGMLKLNTARSRKKLVLGDAKALPFPPRSFDLINLDALMHHLVDFGGYHNTLRSIEGFLVSLRDLLKPDGLVIVREIYHEFWFRDNLGARVIYFVSTLRLPSVVASVLKRLGLETANAGVCFLTSRQWANVLQRAGYNVVSFTDKRWRPNSYRFLGFRRSGDLYYTLSPAAAG